ncbi:MmgE/PrpD family protein [Rhizobium sp. PP-F2F-G48]|nr:MmgE/PrpD family protein [Rhizobium sp. PP-F2F-G48]
MSQNRDTVNGKSADAPVLGYASTVLGTAAAAAMLRGLGTTKIADTLGIAAATSPVNSHKAWCLHSPPSTIKYMLAGTLTQSALTASYMAEFGHRGDHQALDDVEFGYARYIGTIKWAPENITNGLGSLWTFPDLQSYKIYPHVRINAAPLDLMIEIVGAHDIKVEEIESVKAFGEGWAELPSFMNRNIQHVQDAQFSFVHALAVAAHGYEPGKQWQRPDVVFNPSVLNLMERISWEVHPNFFNAYAANPLSRPSRLEVHARGQVFVGEKGYPKGSPSSDPSTYATNDELIEKFKKNASGVLKDSSSDKIIDAVFNLEDLTDIRQLMYYSGGGD